jgi:hypothetical protein
MDMNVARMLYPVACVLIVATFANGQESANRQERTEREERAQIEHDRLMISVQKICPTSGEKLGAHGAPVKVKVGKQIIFLCCKGCLKQKIDPKHWATIHANFAKAQRICPVMKHELPKNPKWTIVDGQIIYICCPPCSKKIAADPKSYIRQLDKLYTASLKSEKTRR